MAGEVEQLGERIAEQAAHLDAATHRLLADLREFDARGGWHTQGARSCAHWLAWRVGWDLATARDRVRVAGKLAEFPLIDDALRRGELSYSKVRAIARVATAENEFMMLEYARFMTGADLDKLCRKYALVQRHGQDIRPRDDEERRYVRRRDTEDGMVKIEAVVHPEEAELIWTMLNEAAKRLSPDPQYAAHPSAGAVSSNPPPPRTPSGDPGIAEISSILHQPGAHHVSAETHASICTGSFTDACSVTAEQTSAVPHQPPPHRVSAETHEPIDMGPVTQTHSAPGVESSAVPHQPPPHRVSAETHEPIDMGPVTQTHSAPGVESSAVPHQPLPHRVSAETHEPIDMAVTENGSVAASETRAMLHQPRPHHVSAETHASNGWGAVGSGSVLRQREDATRRAFNRAEALVSIAQAYVRGDRPNRAPIEIMVTVPASSLRKGSTDPVDSACMGTSCLSPETARRLSCDAGVINIVEDEHGAPLSVGRKRRTIAGSIKRALLKRDIACVFPGCTHSMFLEGHHIQHWADGGETSLENALLLCSHHHRHVHEYGYTVELGSDRHPRFRDPAGRVVQAVPQPVVCTDLGWPHLRRENDALAISANTIACRWDGKPVDYGAIVDYLVRADGLA